MTANAFAEDRQRALCCGHGYAYCKAAEGPEMVETLERFVKSLAEIGAEAQKEYDIKESQPKRLTFPYSAVRCPQLQRNYSAGWETHIRRSFFANRWA